MSGCTHVILSTPCQDNLAGPRLTREESKAKGEGEKEGKIKNLGCRIHLEQAYDKTLTYFSSVLTCLVVVSLDSKDHFLFILSTLKIFLLFVAIGLIYFILIVHMFYP